MLTEGQVKQFLAEANALLDANQAESALDRASDLISGIPSPQLLLTLPDLRNLVERFHHKKRRTLSALLEHRLHRGASSAPQSEATVTQRARSPEILAPDSQVPDYAARLDELREYHVFQWSTFYRATIGYIFKDLLRRGKNAELTDSHLVDVSAEIARHAREIYGQGYFHLTSRMGLPSTVAEAKSLSGLHRFLYLIIDLYIQGRLDVAMAREAKVLRDVTSAMLAGVLGGYGRAQFGQVLGWDLLERFPRGWIHSLGFMTGSDVHALAFEPGGRTLPEGIVDTIVPALLAIDRLANKHQAGDLLLTRLSRPVGEPTQLEITLTSAQRTQSHDTTIVCFFTEVVSERRVIEDALGSGASVAIARVTPELRDWAASIESRLVDSSRLTAFAGMHVHDVSERVFDRLERRITVDLAGATSTLLVRNYAKDFPLEDPVPTSPVPSPSAQC